MKKMTARKMRMTTMTILSISSAIVRAHPPSPGIRHLLAHRPAMPGMAMLMTFFIFVCFLYLFLVYLYLSCVFYVCHPAVPGMAMLMMTTTMMMLMRIILMVRKKRVIVMMVKRRMIVMIVMMVMLFFLKDGLGRFDRCGSLFCERVGIWAMSRINLSHKIQFQIYQGQNVDL